MVGKLFEMVFGCSHSHYCFPRTVHTRSNKAAALTGTYVVCTECGREMPYDWENMAVVRSSSRARQYAHSLSSRQAA